MRELKFRAWVNDDGRYLNESERESFVLKLDGSYHIETKFGFVEFPVIIEQYTGLKDKFGKEIYEGDIVATVYKTKRRTDEDIFGEGHDEWEEKIKGKFEVKYSRRATFGISYVKDPVVIRDLWELGSDIKVIGNIHENPELLEGK